MAFIGMRHVVVAKITDRPENAAPTYSAGMVAGKAITGNLTINRNSNPLYADDVIAEEDNGITSMSLELGLDDLLEDVQAYMGLLKEVTSSGASGGEKTYYETAKSADNVGVGYIRVRRKNGVTKYQAIWIYDALFGRTAENSQTKGETIEWQTPTITGTCMGQYISTVDLSEAVFRQIKMFDTSAEAETWLDSLAGI